MTVEALDWPLLAARFCSLALGIGLFGQACFNLYAPASLRRGGPLLARVVPPVAAAAAALAWNAALGAKAGAPGLGLATREGQALAVAALVALAQAALALSPRRPAKPRAWLAGGFLVSLAFVGHAAMGAGGPGMVRIAVMAAHLLGAGVWLGGILPLLLALPRAGDDLVPLLREFGRYALAAVALLVTSGMVVAVAVISLAQGPPGMTYVKALGAKLALVAIMLAIASLNRWRLAPLAARDPRAARRAFAWTVAAEQALALAVIAAATLLGQISPSL